jgi:chemotaxis methyl-accepting protein methylase
MLFLTYEKSKYELLRKFLVKNSLVDEKSSIDAYNEALIARGREQGFGKLEEYCSYVFGLAYRNFLAEIKSIILTHQPLILYQNRLQLDAISSSLISEILEQADKLSKEKEKTKHSSGWLHKVLTSEIKLKSSPNMTPLFLLGLECGGGEEIYSAAIRMKSIIPENVILDITGAESDSASLGRAREGVFHRGSIINLSDSYRSTYFEKNAEGNFRVTGQIKEMINFRHFDLLTGSLAEEEKGRYNLIFCNNLPRFYPMPVVSALLEKLIPGMAPNGLLFISFPDISNYPSFRHLDILGLGRTFIYRRNRNELSAARDSAISAEADSPDNRIIYAKAKLIENRHEEAMKDVDSILKDRIDSLEANHLKADLYIHQGQTDKGIHQYSKTLLINPIFLPARYNIAALHLLKGDRDKAGEELDKVIKNLDNFDFSMLKPMFNLGLGVFVKQCRFLKQLLVDGREVTYDLLTAGFRKDQEEPSAGPDIAISKTAEEQKAKEEEKKPEEVIPSPPPENGQRKVVNISELPSTRDYGELDPWKLKLAREEEEKGKRESAERARQEIPARKAQDTSELEMPPQFQQPPQQFQQPPQQQQQFQQQFQQPPQPQPPAPAKTPWKMKIDFEDEKPPQHKSGILETKPGVMKLSPEMLTQVTLRPNVPPREETRAESGSLSGSDFEKQRDEARRRVEEQKRRRQEEERLKNENKQLWTEDARKKAEEQRRWMEEAQRRAQEAQKKSKLSKSSTSSLHLVDDAPPVQAQSPVPAGFAHQPQAFPHKPEREEALPINLGTDATIFVKPMDSGRPKSFDTSDLPVETVPRAPAPPKHKAVDTKKMLDTRDLEEAPIDELEHVTETPRSLEQILPRMFLDSLEELLMKEDPKGINELLKSYLQHVSGPQKQTIKLMGRICEVFEEAGKKGTRVFRENPKLREVQEDLKKLKSMIHDKNLLEASILFHKILKIRPPIETMPQFQKERLMRVKEVIEKRSNRSQDFIDKYFTDPVASFQEEMWDALAQLTPPASLEETGVKYGLDPGKMPGKS